MEFTEERLAEGCRRGVAAAPRERYDPDARRLRAGCLRYAGDRAAAEDLLHDAFLKLYGAFDRFRYRGPGSLRAWLERSTVNLAIERLRSRNRRPTVALDEGRLPLVEEALDAGAVAGLSHEVLLRMVGELPEGYRTVFNLFCIEGHSHREIARMLGINEKSSSSQLARARALLASRVRAYLQSQEP